MRTKYWYWIWRTFLGPSRLRKKFIRTFLVAGVIPLVLMVAVSVFLLVRLHRADVATIEENLARQVGQEVDRAVDRTIRALELDVTFDAFAPIAFESQRFVLRNVLDENPALSELSLLCTTPAFCAEGMETRRELQAAGAAAEPLDRSGTPEFAAARAGAAYAGPVSLLGDRLFMVIAAPVMNRKDEVIAVIRGEFNFSEVQRIIEGAQLGSRGYVYLVDEEMDVVAHPTQTFVARRVSAANVPAIAHALRAETNAKAHGEQRYLRYQNFAGETVSGAGFLIPERRWIVVVEWPFSETQRPVMGIVLQLTGFALATLLVILVVASYLAFKLIGPIAYLNQGTAIIGSGNFAYRLRLETKDELEDLARNLNWMAESLRELEELRENKLQAALLAESLRREQELSRLKDQFITTVSHQFNTPLSVINWTLEEIAKPKTPAKAIREGLARIAESRKHILDIANDLITLSEIGFRYRMNKVERVDLAELTREALGRFEPALRAKQIALAPLRVAGDPAVSGNRFGIAKVLENLIDNAITYSHEAGSLEIEIVGEADAVRFSIADRGIGIPKDDQKSIFQEFFRAKNAVLKKNVGTGLGLFLVKTIVEGHGGRAWFESVENRGSTFSFTLPRKPAKPAGNATQATKNTSGK